MPMITSVNFGLMMFYCVSLDAGLPEGCQCIMLHVSWVESHLLIGGIFQCRLAVFI